MDLLTALTYRVAREEELPVCAQLWIEMFEEVGKYKESDFAADWRTRFVAYCARRMRCDELRYFVAERDGEIVGSAGALLRDGYPVEIHELRIGYIFGVSVRAAARRRGAATQLTQLCVDWLKAVDAGRILLHASRFGRPIYESLGFAPTNEMVLREPQDDNGVTQDDSLARGFDRLG